MAATFCRRFWWTKVRLSGAKAYSGAYNGACTGAYIGAYTGACKPMWELTAIRKVAYHYLHSKCTGMSMHVCMLLKPLSCIRFNPHAETAPCLMLKPQIQLEPEQLPFRSLVILGGRDELLGGEEVAVALAAVATARMGQECEALCPAGGKSDLAV